MTTIYDIAKRAGVSVTTVSKVLNQYPDVSEKTRSRVLEITKELGYHPNAVARGLATKRSMTIGVFVEDNVNSGLRHPFFHEVLAQFKDVIGSEGYDLIIFANSLFRESSSDYVAHARNRNVDGIMLFGLPRSDPGLVPLSQSQIPCICIDLDLTGPRVTYITSDNVGGATRAVEYLLAEGHRKIAFIGDPFSAKPGHDRMIGYQETLFKHRVPYRSDWVVSGDYSEVDGYRAAKRLLALDDRPTAMFCISDMMALGAMRAIREEGYRVPEDISIVGFDDINLASYATPPLTTVRQNTVELGNLAAQELMNLIFMPERAPSVTTIETELMVRQTVRSLSTVDLK